MNINSFTHYSSPTSPLQRVGKTRPERTAANLRPKLKISPNSRKGSNPKKVIAVKNNAARASTLEKTAATTSGKAAMHIRGTCPICTDTLLRQVSKSQLNWFCRTCHQNVPGPIAADGNLFD